MARIAALLAPWVAFGQASPSGEPGAPRSKDDLCGCEESPFGADNMRWFKIFAWKVLLSFRLSSFL